MCVKLTWIANYIFLLKKITLYIDAVLRTGVLFKSHFVFGDLGHAKHGNLLGLADWAANVCHIYGSEWRDARFLRIPPKQNSNERNDIWTSYVARSSRWQYWSDLSLLPPGGSSSSTTRSPVCVVLSGFKCVSAPIKGLFFCMSAANLFLVSLFILIYSIFCDFRLLHCVFV